MKRQFQQSQFDLIYETFRKQGYEELWPGISAEDDIATRQKFKVLFTDFYNRSVTRCFGGMPKMRVVPFADFINHHNSFTFKNMCCKEL